MLPVMYLLAVIVFDTVLLLILYAGLSVAIVLPGQMVFVAMMGALVVAAYWQVRIFSLIERALNGRK